LLRSLVWAWQFCILGLPFIEVLSQRHRRALHDRASETMVVTLKVAPDSGPHPLEAHFVRNLIIMVFVALSLWGLLVVSQAYRMADRGDFRRDDLEVNHYFCPAVTEAMTTASHVGGTRVGRVDMALAQFLAGEIEDECLLSEADFALWSGEERQQAWAYLAKSFYYDFDHERSAQYLVQVCKVDSASEPCRLASALANQDHSEFTRGPASLTAAVLQVREFAGHGEFEKGLHQVMELSRNHDGFTKFTQKQTVKFLWILQKHEQAMGAYLNTWPYMDSQDQADLAAWMCLEQVEDRCENRTYAACDNLKETLQVAHFSNANSEAAIGLAEEGDCKKSDDFPFFAFHAILEDNPGLKDLILALSRDSDWNEDKRLDVLRHLSFSDEHSGNRVVQRRALLALLSRSGDVNDFKKAADFLTENANHDWLWQKQAKALWAQAQKRGYQSVAKKVRQEWPQLNSSHQRAPASEAEE